MTEFEKWVDDLERALNKALGDLTPLEQALEIVKAFRKEIGGDWIIEAESDRFRIIERKQKP